MLGSISKIDPRRMLRGGASERDWQGRAVRLHRLYAAALASIVLASCSTTRIERPHTPSGERLIQFTATEVTRGSVDSFNHDDRLAIDAMGGIYLVDTQSGRTQEITSERQWCHSPRVGPSDERIAYVCQSSSGTGELWIRRISYSIGEVTYSDSVYAFDWYGEDHIVFVSSFNSPLKLLDLRNGAVSLVDRATRYVFDVDAQADKGSVVYSISVEGKRTREIVTGVIDSGGIREEKRFAVDAVMPTMSPNLEFLAYRRIAGSDAGVYLYDIENDAEFLVTRSSDMPQGLGGFDETKSSAMSFSFDSQALYYFSQGKLHRYDIAKQVLSSIPLSLNISKWVSRRAEPSAPQRPTSDDRQNTRFLRWPDIATSTGELVFSSFGEIWVVGKDKKAASISVSNTLDYSPAISASGSSIVYVASGSAGRSYLQRLNRRTGEFQTIFGEDHPAFIANPTFTPDEREVVFWYARTDSFVPWRSRKKRAIELVALDVASGDLRKLTDYAWPRHSLSQIYPSISLTANGERAYFVEASDDQFSLHQQLVSVNLNSGEKKRHLTFPTSVDDVVVSPDEARLAVLDRSNIRLLETPSRRRYEPESSFSFFVESIAHPLIRSELISVGGAIYPRWKNDNTLIWSSDSEVKSWSADTRQVSSLFSGGIGASPVNRVSSKKVAFVGGTVITQNDSQEVVRDAVLLLEGGKITEVGERDSVIVPNDAVVVDIRNKTVLPGLIDTHFHLFSQYEEDLEYWPHQFPSFTAALAYGVTTAFDPSAPEIDSFALAEMVDTHLMHGPRVFASGLPLAGFANNYPPYAGVNIQDRDDATNLVGVLSSRGANILKSYALETRRERRLLLAAAREKGLGVTAEGSSDLLHNLEFIRDGHTSIEHFLSGEELYSDFVEFVVQSGIFWNGTLLAYGYPIGFFYYQPCFMQKLSAKEYRYIGAEEFHYLGPVVGNGCQEIGMQSKLRAARSLVRILGAGGSVTVGSHGDHPGLGTHWEMWMYELAGASAESVLRSATINGARQLRIDHLVGSVEEGKLGDLVILNCNPLEDLRCTVDIEYVAKNGLVYHAESMTQMWPEYEPLHKPHWHSDEDWEELKPELPEPWDGVPIADGIKLEQPTIH